MIFEEILYYWSTVSLYHLLLGSIMVSNLSRITFCT